MQMDKIMTRLLIRLGVNLLTLVFVVGCCKVPHNKPPKDVQVEPIWAQSLMEGSTASMVWNGGLGTPMKYKNDIIFGTTLTNNDEVTDNRLCGLDADTGKIKWLFPSERTKTYNYQFEGNGYIYGNRLVVKSPPLGLKRMENEILCVNLDERRLIHNRTLPSGHTLNDAYCYGHNQYVVWTENQKDKSEIFRIDIQTGEVKAIVTLDQAADSDVDLFIISFHDGKLLYLEQEEIALVPYKKFLCMYDVKQECLLERYELNVHYERWVLTDLGIDENNVLYLRVGPYVLAVNLKDGAIMWKTDIKEHQNSWVTRDAALCGNILFLIGDQIYMAVDKRTGNIIYKKRVEGGKWVVANSGYIYANILGVLHVLDPASGEGLGKIVCPEEYRDGFDITIKPSFYDGKMYLASYRTAYCYPTYPWKE